MVPRSAVRLQHLLLALVARDRHDGGGVHVAIAPMDRSFFARVIGLSLNHR